MLSKLWKCFALLVMVTFMSVQVLADEAKKEKEPSDTESVVVDGDFVSIRSGDDEIVVSGDWRKAGKVYSAGETERLLIDLGAVVTDERIVLNLTGDILFAFNSIEILPDAAAKLSQVAGLIRTQSVGKVHVIGHTDSIGSDEYNKKLSQERAVAVMRWLHHHEDIPSAIVIGSGMGAKQPIAPNTLANGSDNPTGRARNRRVEIQMAKQEGVTLGPSLFTLSPDLSIVSIAAKKPKEGTGTATCASLCKATEGKQSFATIGCIEGTFEELGFDMDSDSCDELEDAMATGYGNEGGSLCTACQKEEGFGDSQCGSVAAQCFPSLK